MPTLHASYFTKRTAAQQVTLNRRETFFRRWALESSLFSQFDSDARDSDSGGNDSVGEPSESVYRRIESALEELDRRGGAATPTDLKGLLPTGVGDEVRGFILVELIKYDMALAADRGELRLVENYARELGDLLPAAIPLDLAMEEFQLAREHGEPTAVNGSRWLEVFGDDLLNIVELSEATAPLPHRGTMPDLPLGSQIDDFLVLRKLGRGAFAHVYLARQISMQRLIALKVSRGRGSESQTLAQFDHPNIVRVFDQRTLPDRSLHLLYMQYQPGGTLADVVRLVRETELSRRGGLLLESVDRNLLAAEQVAPENSVVRAWLATKEWPTVVAWIGVQLAQALEASHRRGVLHRDVKPANVLLSAEGIPKLADFNVSQAGAAGRAGATASFGGSVGYMAPEHLQAIQPASLDAPEVREPADLYSLGVLLWELWQGRRPFSVVRSATSWSEVVEQQMKSRERDLISPQRGNSASERVLERTLRTALARAANDRLGSCAEMSSRLRLAIHPQAANLFYPDQRTFRDWLAGLNPMSLVGVTVVAPHLFAAFFHYQYNANEIHQSAQPTLRAISPWLTAAAFAATIVLVAWYSRAIERALKSSREATARECDLDAALAVAERAAWFGGLGWAIAGLLFCVVLQLASVALSSTEWSHFFVSFLICGGVATVYPFFGLAWVGTHVYYPRMVRFSMDDDAFARRETKLIRLCERYLLLSVVIPLLGAALLLTSETASQSWVLAAICAGVMGVIASFYAYRSIVTTWAQMREVLASRLELAAE